MNSDIKTARMHLKERAINYFKGNGIPKLVEKSLNDMFNDLPEDACGFLSKYFENLSLRPRLSKIHAFETIGDFGVNSIGIKLFAVYRNEETEIVNITVPNNFSIKQGETFNFDNAKSHENVVKKCIQIINQDIALMINRADQKDYEDIVQILQADALERQLHYEEEIQTNRANEMNNEEEKKEESKNKVASGKNKKTPVLVCVPDDPPEVICPDLTAHFVVSIALAKMASVVENQTIYKYTLNRMEDQSRFSTIPAISVLANGKGFPGKCQIIKKCFIVPNGLYDSSNQIATDLRTLSLKIWAIIQSKFPATIINDRCEMVPAFDKPEQFLDVIMDALKELQLEEKIKVIFEIGAQWIFDSNKGKYEVISGQLKSSDELVIMFKDLVDRYPIIVGLVNPLRKQDAEQWNNLVTAVSNRCWILGRSPVFPRSQKIAENSQLYKECMSKASMIGLDIDGYSLYENYLKASKQLIVDNKKLCVWLEDLCGQNWLLDMACGLRSYLLMLPSLRSSSGANKLDRWAELMSDCVVEPGLIFPDLCSENNSVTEET